MSPNPDKTISTLIATVDQLQAELDRHELMLGLMVLALLALAGAQLLRELHHP